jgi:hypothetical protein
MLCPPGGAVDLFDSGATGIANVWEICQHLRGEAGPRQINGARVGLAHMIGLGSACGIHILERAA